MAPMAIEHTTDTLKSVIKAYDIRGVVGAVAGAARDLGLPEADGPEAAARKIIVVSLSGRGDKDVTEVMRLMDMQQKKVSHERCS